VKEFGELSTKLEFGGFDDVATDGGQPEGKDTKTNRPRRRPMKAEEGKRVWKMGSQNLSRGWKPNRQRLMNINSNGR